MEYKTNHKSNSVTVKLELCPTSLIELNNNEPIYALIWTTTPWTLPGNVAVVYSSNLLYSFVKIHDTSGIYLLATDLIKYLSAKINKSIEIVSTFKGRYHTFICFFKCIELKSFFRLSTQRFKIQKFEIW